MKRGNMQMKNDNTFYRSQIILLAASVGRLLLSLIITVFLARILSPADYGFFAFVSAILVMAHDLVDLGTGNVTAREVARNPGRERPILESLLGGRRFISGIMAAACLVLALAHRDISQRLMLSVVAVVLWSMYLSALTTVFQVRQNHDRPALLAVGAQLLLLLGSMVLFLFKAAGLMYVLLAVVREVVILLGNKVLACRLLGYRPVPKTSLEDTKRFFGQAAVFGLAALFYNLYFHNGTFLVWLLRSEREAGAFAAAFRLIQPLLSLSWVLMIPLVPVLARISVGDRFLFSKQVPVLLYIAFGIGSVSAVSGYILGPGCLELLYAGKFSTGELSAVDAFRWLSLAFGVSCLNAVLVTVLLADGKEKDLLVLSLVGFLFNIAANLLLLPSEGFSAVAMVTAMTELLVCLGGFLLVWKSNRSLKLNARAVPFLLPMVILPGVFQILPSAPLIRVSLGALLAAMGVFYILCLPAVSHCRQELRAAG